MLRVSTYRQEYLIPSRLDYKLGLGSYVNIQNYLRWKISDYIWVVFDNSGMICDRSYQYAGRG